MATEATSQEGKTVVKAQISSWRLKQNEQALFARSGDLPNWKLADKTRRMLADLSVHFSDSLPAFDGVAVQSIDSDTARKWAVIAASGIVVRSAGGAMALLACGYEPESGGQMRRIIEAKLNAQEILEDHPSGQYALRYLQGRPRGLAKLATKYEASEDVKLLSILSHADARGLALLSDEPQIIYSDEPGETTVNLYPRRNVNQAHDLLYAIAYECGGMCAALAEAFSVGVEIPPWVNHELLRLRDLLKESRVRSG